MREKSVCFDISDIYLHEIEAEERLWQPFRIVLSSGHYSILKIC